MKNKVHVPAPLSKKDQKIVDRLYYFYGVKDGTIQDKINALFKEIGKRKFIIDGGYSKEMELRANERIFLLNLKNDIKFGNKYNEKVMPTFKGQRRYATIEAMMRGTGISEDIIRKVKDLRWKDAWKECDKITRKKL